MRIRWLGSRFRSPRDGSRTVSLSLAAQLGTLTPAADAHDARHLHSYLSHAEDLPDFHPILEKMGEHVHSCGNVLLNVTNFDLVGLPNADATHFGHDFSAQWSSDSSVKYLSGGSLGRSEEEQELAASGVCAQSAAHDNRDWFPGHVLLGLRLHRVKVFDGYRRVCAVFGGHSRPIPEVAPSGRTRAEASRGGKQMKVETLL